VLPPAARGQATASIAATQAAAQHLGPAGRGLLAAADRSFVHAMHLTSVISLSIAVLGAVVVAIWMPGRRPALATAASGPGAATSAANGSAPAPVTPAAPVTPTRPAAANGSAPAAANGSAPAAVVPVTPAAPVTPARRGNAT